MVRFRLDIPLKCESRFFSNFDKDIIKAYRDKIELMQEQFHDTLNMEKEEKMLETMQNKVIKNGLILTKLIRAIKIISVKA
jgi:hypothetical protein